MRYLSEDEGRAAAWGGLVYGAGGGGLEAGLASVDMVFQLGRPRLATVEELAEDDLTVVTTGVGAPGAHTQTTYPRDSAIAFGMVRDKVARPVRGIITGHPGAFMPRSWLHSAMNPDVAVVDCATNGRGHPSVRMGGMGIAGDLSQHVVQAAVGGLDEEHGRLEIMLDGPLAPGSDVLRRAASALGGSIAACRGPFSAGFLATSGAVGAVSASIALGEAMMAAKDDGAQRMIDAVVDTLDAAVVATGQVSGNTVELQGAYDVGTIDLKDGSADVSVAVCNEYLAVDVDGQRKASFPDLIVLLSQQSGMPASAADVTAGEPVVVVVAARDRIPLGAGVWDRVAYDGVEKLLGIDLRGYL